MNKFILQLLSAAFLVLSVVACQITPTSTLIPTLEPTVTSRPTSTNTPIPKPTATSIPTSTITPEPVGEVDTEMGGSLSIQGVARDSLGNVAPDVYVQLSVYGQGGGWDIGKFGDWYLYTDEQGYYSFKNILKLERGHYEVWFNGGKEYGKEYEHSGYYIPDNEISGDIYSLNVTVHPITGSAFSGLIQYQDIDGSIKSFYSPLFPEPDPGHVLEIFRGSPDNTEYGIGAQYGRIIGDIIEWQNLAGGTYYLAFTYRRIDGVLVQCTCPSFDITPGETKNFEYTIRDCPPVPVNEALLP